MKILILGNGILGTEIHKETGWDIKSRSVDGIDLTDEKTWAGVITQYDVVINCMGYTNTYDTDRNTHWEVNAKATSKLVDACLEGGIKLVQISTDYIFANSDSNAHATETVPVHHKSWYGYSKQIIDGYIQLRGGNHLLIRCGHKPRPFPYNSAPNTMIGNFDYVDVIAQKIVGLIMMEAKGVHNVGTETKSMYDLARRTKPDVKIDYKLPVATMPTNVTMDI